MARCPHAEAHDHTDGHWTGTTECVCTNNNNNININSLDKCAGFSFAPASARSQGSHVSDEYVCVYMSCVCRLYVGWERVCAILELESDGSGWLAGCCLLAQTL